MQDALQVGLEAGAGEEAVSALVSQICPTKPSATSSATDEAAEQFFLEVDLGSFAGLPPVLRDFATIKELVKPSSGEQHQKAFSAAVAAQKVSGGKRAVDSVLSAFALSKFGKAKLKEVGKAIEMGAVAKAKNTAADHALKALQDLLKDLKAKEVFSASSATFHEFDKKVSVLANATSSASPGTAAMGESVLHVLNFCIAQVVQEFVKIIGSDWETEKIIKAITGMQDVFTSMEKSWRTWHTETQQKIIQDDKSYTTCPALYLFRAV